VAASVLAASSLLTLAGCKKDAAAAAGGAAGMQAKPDAVETSPLNKVHKGDTFGATI